MARVEHQAGQQALTEHLRPRFFLLQAGQALRAHAFDLGRVETRTLQHVGEQGERVAEVFHQGRQAGGGAVETGAGAEIGAQAFGAVVERHGVVIAGAFVEHAGSEAGQAFLAGRIAGEAAVELQAHLHDGHVVAFGQDDLQAVVERGAMQGREHQFRKLCRQRHAFRAVERAGRRLELRIGRRDRHRRGFFRRRFDDRRDVAGHHGQGVVALTQPGAAGIAHLRGGAVLQTRQRFAEATGIAGIDGAFGQHVGLAAETADALDAADEAGADHRLRLRQFVGGRAFGEQTVEFFLDDGFDLGRIDVLLHVGGDDEHAAELAAVGAGADVVGELVAEHEAAIQARRGTAAQHLAEQGQAIGVGGVVLRHVPHLVDARLRYAIAQRLARGGLARRRHRPLRGKRGAGRDVAEIFHRLGFRRRHIDVAGEHEHGIVRAVPGAEPVLDVFQRGRVQIVHRTDRAVLVGMTVRIARFQQGIPDATVRLVLALALFVLHHAALFVERGLIDRAEQMAHAIRFHEQRGVERGGRHVLEIIRAVGVGGAVLVGHADLLEGHEILVLVVLAALEHQMFEQVGETAAPGRLVLGTDVVPDVDGDDRRFAVGVHDHAQAVGQGELFEGDVDRRRFGGDGRRRERQAGGERDGQGEQGGAGPEGETGHGRPGWGKRRPC